MTALTPYICPLCLHGPVLKLQAWTCSAACHPAVQGSSQVAYLPAKESLHVKEAQGLPLHVSHLQATGLGHRCTGIKGMGCCPHTTSDSGQCLQQSSKCTSRL